MNKLLMLIACVCLLAPGASASRTVTDETGHAVRVPDHPHRIICLLPSLTDTVFAMGAADDVVAVTDYANFPEAAKKKPSVGSILTPSLETILSLHPDLVLAIPHWNQQSTIDKIQDLGIPVFMVEPHGLNGVMRSILILGQAMNREAQATALVAQLQQRIAVVHARAQGKPAVSVYMPISYEPNISIGKGSFINDIIEAAGGHSITSDIDQEWPVISMEIVIARAPQALVLFRHDKMTLDTLETRPGWNALPAVRNRRVYYVDDRITSPSPIAIDALEDLARQFHP